ncbi:hypothetical protein [Duganella callida]|uniref:Uncharacterized protein n=1 Tax=Duganella callida TaxID=2561932 RepID=A0A4Y9S427_9BURK|nr:hypothetical protein [Duganella callida]TFW15921.1 hypothetical protein E4L98_24810 [Duganella callida]
MSAAIAALEHIITVARCAGAKLNGRELRVVEIALEGLGYSPDARQQELRILIQWKRDRIMQRRARRKDRREAA